MFKRTGDKMKSLKNISLLLTGCLLILASVMPTGTYSFFSSNQTKNSAIKVGSCSQKINTDVNYELSDLYPGQEPQKLEIDIENDGTLEINQLELSAEIEVTDKEGNLLPYNRAEEVLSQLDIQIASDHDTLKGIDFSELEQGIDLTEIEELDLEEGIDVKEHLNADIILKFDEKNEEQAKFEDWSLSTKFVVEGTC